MPLARSGSRALNLAKTWGLRVLWVCENNQYGMGTAVNRASAVDEIRQKAEGYGMKNGEVNGMDVMAVYEAAKEAIDFVRKEGQPFLLEVDTYRFRGHSMGDPERYRKAEEVKQWQENDPIGIFNKYLLDKKVATRKSLDEIEARVEERGVGGKLEIADLERLVSHPKGDRHRACSIPSIFRGGDDDLDHGRFSPERLADVPEE